MNQVFSITNSESEVNFEINKETIFQLFKQSLSEKDTKVRQKIESQINLLNSNFISFINTVHQILIDQNYSSEESIVLMIVVFLKNSVSHNLEMSFYKKNNNDMLTLLQGLMPIVCLTGYANKRISDSLEQILTTLLKSQAILGNEQILKMMIDHVCLNYSNNPCLEAMINVCMMTFNVMNADSKNNIFSSLVNSTTKNILLMVKIYTEESLSKITSLDENTIQTYCRLIVLKKKFFELLFLTSMKLRKINNLNSNFKEEFINSYLSFAVEAIEYETQGRSFMSFTNNHLIDSSINGMKGKAFMWISMLIQYDGTEIIQHPKLVEISISLFKLITSGFKYIIKNHMTYLSKMTNNASNKELQDNEYSFIIFQANLFLSRVLIREPLHTTMINNIKEFVFEIILPMIISTTNEYIIMKTDGEAHHGFNIDLLGDYVIFLNRMIKAIKPQLHLFYSNSLKNMMD